MNQRTKLIVVAAILGIGIVAIVAFFFLRDGSAEPPPTTLGTSNSPPQVIPPNAFQNQPSNVVPPWYVNIPPLQSPPTPPPQNAFDTTLNDLGKSIFPETVIEPPPTQLLALPETPAAELTVNQGGISSLPSYIESLATNGDKVKFPVEKFDVLLKDASGRPLLPEELVDKGLAENNLSGIHDSLATLQEFFKNKIEYEKSIAVYGNGISASQTIIGIDKLKLDLIGNTFALENRTMARSAFDEFYTKYKNTLTSYGTRIIGASGLTFGGENFFTRLGSFFSRTAKAAGFNYGGLITYVNYCTCTGAAVTVVGTAGGEIFFYWATYYGSPYLYHKVTSGSYILGTSIPIGGYCSYPPYCTGTYLGSGTATIFYGTSL